MSNLNQMGGRMEENEWQSDAFRQSMVRKLEEAIKVIFWNKFLLALFREKELRYQVFRGTYTILKAQLSNFE